MVNTRPPDSALVPHCSWTAPHRNCIALPVMIVVHLALLVLTWYGKIPRVAAYVVYLITVMLCTFGNSIGGIPKCTQS